MTHSKWALILLALAAGAMSLQAQVRFAADVPLLSCDGLPCVAASVNGRAPARLLVDSGDAVTIFDTRAARELGLELTTPKRPNWPAGYHISAIGELRIGGVELAVPRLLTMDLAALAARHEMPHAAGFLAYTAFRDREVELDFPARRLRISAPLTATVACAGHCARFSLIPFGKHGPPIVVAQGFSIAGRAVTAQVDTLFSGSFLVYDASLAKLGLAQTAARTQSIVAIPFTDGGVRMKVAAAPVEAFTGQPLARRGAQVYFATPGVHQPDGLFDATVGYGLLRHSVVTLDFHNQTIAVR